MSALAKPMKIEMDIPPLSMQDPKEWQLRQTDLPVDVILHLRPFACPYCAVSTWGFVQMTALK